MDDQSVQIDENSDEIAATQEAGGSESSTDQSGMFQTLRATHDSSEADDEDEEEEEDEDEEEDEEEYYEGEDEDDASAIDLWEDDEVVAFGDDLEVKFDAGIVAEIARAIDIVDEIGARSMLVWPLGTFPGYGPGPVPKIPSIRWIDVSEWANLHKVLDDLGADYNNEKRIDREGWHEIVAVWRWTDGLGAPYVAENYQGGSPTDYRLLEQSNELQKTWNRNATPAQQIDLILENLRKQALILLRESLRDEIATYHEEMAELAQNEADAVASGEGGDMSWLTSTREEIQAKLNDAQAKLDDAVAQCRAVGVNN